MRTAGMGDGSDAQIRALPNRFRNWICKTLVRLISGTNLTEGNGAMNKNEVKGRMKQVKGKAKEVFGRVTGDKSLKFKGKATKAAGRMQVRTGNLERK